MSRQDFILPISFQTAQEIGLEESVLIAFLEQRSFLLSSAILNFELEALSAQLPFWTVPMLMRTLSSLQANNLLSFERQAGQLVIRLEEGDLSDIKEVRPASRSEVRDTSHKQDALEKVGRLQREASHQQGQNQVRNAPREMTKSSPVSYPSEEGGYLPAQPANRPNYQTWSGGAKTRDDKRRGVSDFDLYLEQKERARQPDQWQPEESTIEQISQAGINKQFAQQLLPEFLLRIKEQRKNVRTWNSEFFKYVKRQWQYKQSERSSYEGTQSSPYHSRTSKEQVSDALTNIHDTDW